MKFIHTGDLHYGMNPDSDKPWSKERAQAVRDALASIVSAAGIPALKNGNNGGASFYN